MDRGLSGMGYIFEFLKMWKNKTAFNNYSNFLMKKKIKIPSQWLGELKRPASFVNKAKLKYFSVRQVIKKLCFQLISYYELLRRKTQIKQFL